MFKKNPRRAFRRRRDSSSEEEHGGGEQEEQEEVKKASRPAQSRGLSCQSKPEETPPEADSSDGETGEKREEKREEKKSQSVLSFSDKEGEESAFKVKKSSDRAVLFQVRKKDPPATETRQSSAVRRVPPSASPRRDDDSPASSRDDGDDDDDDGDDDDDSDSDEDDARSPSVSSDSSHSAAKPVVIPNAKQIKAAKRQRHATRTQKDFISLNSAGRTLDHYSREDDEDRSEDDDDDELDDHEARIQFAPRLKSIRERIAEKLGESDGSLSLSDGEEQELWEELQIEKGVKRRPGGQSPCGSESSSFSCSSDGRTDGRRLKKRSTGVHVPKLPPVTVSMVRRRITGKLDSLKEVHRARQAELRRMENDVECARTSLEALEESSPENRLKFYRNTTLYVHNLVECLREKVIEINSLELELHSVLSEHQDEKLEQRRQRVKQQQLSCNTEQNENSTNGKTTDEAEESQTSADEDEELHKKTADLLLRSQSVFSDVQAEFCDVKKVLCRFEEWRTFHSDSYHNAYISLCLPKLLNPIIRHQLLAWSPLKDSMEDLENLSWFSAVETFCHGHGHEELEQQDRQTLSSIMERTVLPRVTGLVDLVWDPFSSRQSSCLSAVCLRLRDDYQILDGESSKHVQAFREAVIRRLRSSVDEDVFIPLFPKQSLEDESSPQRRFRDQQFRTALKLLGIMGKWDQLLPESVLKELMLDKLLNRYLMISLNQTLISSTDITDITKIADSLPSSWFRGVESCLPQLQSFRDFLVHRVHAVCREQRPQDQSTRALVVPFLQVLSRIRCNENIMEIAERYHYEDLVYTHQLINQENQ